MGLGSSDDEMMMRGREPLENMNLHESEVQSGNGSSADERQTPT